LARHHYPITVSQTPMIEMTPAAATGPRRIGQVSGGFR
jgi:hypothetical protein